MTINRKKYFDRIGYKGQTDVSVETLKNIHRAQIFSIPFENMEIQKIQNVNNLNHIIKLDETSLFKKLVEEKRGGYCHENNELLALVLEDLGFKVERLVARVLQPANSNLPIGHKLLLVTIKNQKFIADVGFGSYGIFEPLPLIENQESVQYGDRFKLILKDDNYIYQIFNKKTDSWTSMYEFTLQVYLPVDFEQMSYYVSHIHDSIFVTNRICVLPTPEGRIILNDYNLKVPGKPDETLAEGPEYFAALKKYFGIALPEDTQFKPIAAKKGKEAEKTLTSTVNNMPNSPAQNDRTWCRYFNKSTVVAGVTGAAYIATKTLLG